MNNERLTKFTDMISKEIYSEPDTDLHTNLINQIVPDLLKVPHGIKPDSKIVDIGCGSGYMLDKLVENGVDKNNVVAVTASEEDYNVVKGKGYEAYQYDMTFTEFEDDTFDYVIMRHCLEHSVWPYLTLLEMNRILKMHGRMYIEMPAPDTDRKLEHWGNHYSVMGQTMWGSLMHRAGMFWKSGSYNMGLTDSKDGRKFQEHYHWYATEKLVDRKDFKPADQAYMVELGRIYQETKTI